MKIRIKNIVTEMTNAMLNVCYFKNLIKYHKSSNDYGYSDFYT